MPQELQLPDGRILVIPDNMTLDQRAALRNKLGAQYADIKTGKGMYEKSLQQSKQQTGAPVIKAAEEHEARQKLLGERMNRAANSPMPFTNASMAYFPAASARMLAGSKVGGYAGEKLAPKGYENVGRLIGGTVGGIGASAGPALANRISKMGIEVPEKVNLPGGFKLTTGNPPPEPSVIPASQSPGPYRGPSSVPKPAVGKVAMGPGPYKGPASVPEPSPIPVSATSSATPIGKAELPATWSGPSTTGPPPGGEQVPLTSRIAQGSAPEGSLTRRIITPGEEIDPLARSSAGSAAQATEEDLRRLAGAGDASARQELIRRRLPLGSEGQIDYSKAPLPKGSLAERIGQSSEVPWDEQVKMRSPGENPAIKSIRRQRMNPEEEQVERFRKKLREE
jgi:hypothetical protein